MSEVRSWLQAIGLGQYADVFHANDLDMDLLRQVDDQILKDIGVSSAGHRLRIRNAIAKLGPEATHGKEGAATGATIANVEVRQPTLSTAAGATPVSAAAEVAGERRYLTVMFCDLVGSTGISAQLDAEEWRDLIGSYLDVACAAVTELGGHVAKKLGDGLMCLFGYPLAHENDAERAARAALSIQRPLAELNRKNAGTAKPELAARIGLESGLAVLDASGEIFGDVANIAARVQALAEPGAVLVTARVQRQVASRICTGPIRPRSTCCAALPSAARWCRSTSWRRPGPSFARPGACARITAPFHSLRSTAPRCEKWWPNFPLVTRWGVMSSMMSRRAPAAYRCLLRR